MQSQNLSCTPTDVRDVNLWCQFLFLSTTPTQSSIDSVIIIVLLYLSLFQSHIRWPWRHGHMRLIYKHKLDVLQRSKTAAAAISHQKVIAFYILEFKLNRPQTWLNDAVCYIYLIKEQTSVLAIRCNYLLIQLILCNSFNYKKKIIIIIIKNIMLFSVLNVLV